LLICLIPGFVRGICPVPDHDSSIMWISCDEEACYVQCEETLEEHVINCDRDGNLERSLPSCIEAECPAIKASPNRIDECDTISCKFSCPEDKELVGPSSILCENGEWSADLPICGATNTCDIPEEPENGFVKCTGQSRQSVCEYSCKDGFMLNGERSRTCEYSEEKLSWSGELPSCQKNLFTPIPPDSENSSPPILTPDDDEQSVWSLLRENQIVIGISAGVFLLILTLSVMLAYCIRKKRTGKESSELEIYNKFDRNPTLNLENTYTDQIVTSGPNRDNSISDPSQTFYQPNHNRAQYPIRGNVSPYSQVNVGNGNSENDHLLTVDEGGPSIYDPSNADQTQYPSSRGPSQNQNYYRPNMATFIY